MAFVSDNPQHLKDKTIESDNQEALFLDQKSKIVAMLAITTSQTGIYKRLQQPMSTSSADKSQDNGEVGSNSSQALQPNKDLSQFE